MARIGLFGGTFDPVHLGHLLMAETARQELTLDRVVFVPASRPPHKADARITPGEHRLRMVELAIAGNAAFEVEDVELRRGGTSYSVDTVAEFRSRLDADDKVFFLVGADTLTELPTWREPARLAELATIAVLARPGHKVRDYADLADTFQPDQVESLQRHTLRMPLVELASRHIRAAIRDGRSIRYRVPDAVREYIESHGLYRE